MVKLQSIMRYMLSPAFAIALAITLSACQSPQTSNSARSHATHSNSYVKAKILKQYAHWKGVRYRLGGNSKRGVDCSAFVQLAFRDQFGLNLPRTTSGLQKIGKRVPRTKLRPGDLVFFRTGSTSRHVGVYLDNDQFVHASTSRGVMISSLSNKYWHKHYRDARRVL